MSNDLVECERCKMRYKHPYYRCLECGANTIFIGGIFKGKKVIDLIRRGTI